MIELRNLQRKVPLNLPWLRRFAPVAQEICLQAPAGGISVLEQLEEIDIAIVSDKRIAQVHVDFMGIPGATDVITFEHGEIVISAETARLYAAEYGSSTDEEVALYILHGLLHLHGYDDLTAKDHRRMHSVQSRLMKACLRAVGGD